MKAIIKTGGKQYIVSEGQTLKVEKIKEANVGDEIAVGEVLLTYNNKDIKVGTPIVEGAVVKGTVLEVKKDRKIVIRKYKNKTRYRKTIGHRQIKATIKITSIA